MGALADRHVAVAAPVVAVARPVWAWPPAGVVHRDQLAPPPPVPQMPDFVDADGDVAADVEVEVDAVSGVAPAAPSPWAH